MAGTFVLIPCKHNQRPLVRSLLRRCQRMAKDENVRVRFKWEAWRYHTTIDGDFPTMQTLAYRLRLELPVLALGLPRPTSSREREATARTIAKAFDTSIADFSRDLAMISDMFGGTPTSLAFHPGPATHTIGILKQFTNNLVLFRRGILDASTTAESAHTALELLLRTVLSRSAKGTAFADLVSRAAERGYLNKALVPSLLSIKELRRGAKHFGQAVRRSRLARLLDDAVLACQQLAKVLRLLPRHGS